MAKPAVGIDIGNTHYRIAVCSNSFDVQIISVEGERKTPAYVTFKPDNSRLIGKKAAIQLPLNPISTFFDAKKLIGRKIDDPVILKNTKEWVHWPFKVARKNNNGNIQMQGTFTTTIGDPTFFYDPEAIVAMVLKNMLDKASSHLGTPITEACISVPASFSYIQRQAVLDAGTIAGLDKIHLIHESSAVALAYGFQTRRDKKVLFVDWGGSACNVSFVEYDETGAIEVKATAGVPVGGEDFTDLLVDYCIRHLDKSIFSSWKVIHNLRRNCEEAKITLSAANKTEIVVDYQRGSQTTQVSRKDFEDLCDGHFKQCLVAIKQTLSKSSAVDEIVLVGGSTRIPKIKQLIEELVGKPSSRIGIRDTEEEVVRGAAMRARLIMSPTPTDVVLLDITPFDIMAKINNNNNEQNNNKQINNNSEQMIIPAHTRFPKSQSRSLTYSPANDPYLEVYENGRKIGSRKLSTHLKREGEVTMKLEFCEPNRILEVTVTDAENNCVVLSTRNLSDSDSILNSMKIEQKFVEHEKRRQGEEDRLQAKKRLEEYITQLNNIANKTNKWIMENQAAEREDFDNQMNQIMESVNILNNNNNDNFDNRKKAKR